MMVCILWAHAAVTFEPVPTFGVESIVTVTDEEAPSRGETVRVIHRPGTIHERERAIGITDGRGRVRWTPEEAGVAKIRIGNAVEPVHIRWGGPPSAVAVLLVVLILANLGFALTGFRRMRRT